MSLYLSLGMELGDILGAVTATPARLMGMAGRIGTLQPGAHGDISIFRIIEKEYFLNDHSNAEYTAGRLLLPQMTIADGEIAFCQQDFNLLQGGTSAPAGEN